jgi:flagellar hook-length control protein FliK
LAFEASVLEKLQQGAFGQQASGQSDQSDSKNDDGQPKDSFKDLKSDMLNSTSLQHAGQSHGEFKTHLTNSASPIAEATATQKMDEPEKNIQEIMNKAQYLVKQGGGEMNVKMSPDGLGEVQLKVLLQDGKVNIEMQTQDKSVKKLIEDSLSELKSSLAAHRLSVEHVRIDTVNATNTDNNTQFQSNLNNSGSDDRQREYWKQFQDNLSQNQSRRANYSGTTSGSVKPTAATSTSQSVSALRTYGGTKGATLNSVG